MDSLIGIVLCGGKSSRMGQDKGMLMLGKDTWAEIAYSKLKFFSIPVYVSINKSQRFDYQKWFDESTLIEDEFHAEGPLRGILSAHRLFPEKDLMILSCDMPFMNLSVLYPLFNNYVFFKNKFEFFSYSIHHRFEPLCSIYTSAGLNKINLEYSVDKLAGYSLQSILKTSRTKEFPVQKEYEQCFTNFNYPAHLELMLNNVDLEL